MRSRWISSSSPTCLFLGRFELRRGLRWRSTGAHVDVHDPGTANRFEAQGSSVLLFGARNSYVALATSGRRSPCSRR
jgi:hypothetical protein